MGGKREMENSQLTKEQYEAAMKSTSAGSGPGKFQAAKKEIMGKRRMLKVANRPKPTTPDSSNFFGGVNLTAKNTGFNFSNLQTSNTVDTGTSAAASSGGGFSFTKVNSAKSPSGEASGGFSFGTTTATGNSSISASTATAPAGGFSFGTTTTSSTDAANDTKTGSAPTTTGGFAFPSTSATSDTSATKKVDSPANAAATTTNAAPSNATTSHEQVQFWRHQQEELWKEHKEQIRSFPKTQNLQIWLRPMTSFLMANERIQASMDKIEHQNKSSAVTTGKPAATAAEPTPEAAKPFAFSSNNANTATASPSPAAKPFLSTVTTTPSSTAPAAAAPTSALATPAATSTGADGVAASVADPDWDDAGEYHNIRMFRSLKQTKKWKSFADKVRFRVQTHKQTPTKHRMVVRDEASGKVKFNAMVLPKTKFTFAKQKSKKLGEYGSVVFIANNDAEVGIETFLIKTTVDTAQKIADQLMSLADKATS